MELGEVLNKMRNEAIFSKNNSNQFGVQKLFNCAYNAGMADGFARAIEMIENLITEQNNEGE